jgi:hypothetical protein
MSIKSAQFLVKLDLDRVVERMLNPVDGSVSKLVNDLAEKRTKLEEAIGKIVDNVVGELKDVGETIGDGIDEEDYHDLDEWKTLSKELNAELGKVAEKLATLVTTLEPMREEANEAAIQVEDAAGEVSNQLENSSYTTGEDLVEELAFFDLTVVRRGASQAEASAAKPEHRADEQAKGRRPARLVHVADACHAVVRRMRRQGRSFVVAESWECIDEADVAATILDKMRRRAEAMTNEVQKRSLLRAVTCKDLKKSTYFWSQFVPDERFDVNRLAKR